MNIDPATSQLETHTDYRVPRRLGIADADVAENIGG
jgi:hypothetical protein